MATYVNDLRLKEIGTGESSGTWGSETNTNLELIGEALGFGTEAITTNADTHTTTVADGSTDPGRAMYLKYTGTLDSACTITIAPNTMSRMQFIENGTSGSQNIIISQGTGANVTIPAGDTKAVYLDGAGSGAAVVDAFASLNTVDLKVEDDLTVTDDVSIGGALTLTGNGDFNGDLDVDGTTNLDVVDIDGAVDMATTLAVGGLITVGDGHTIGNDGDDNLVITGSANENVIIDSAVDIILDADDADIIFKDGGTEIARFTHSASDFKIDSAGDIIFDAAGADFIFADDGTSIGSLFNSSTDFIIKSLVDDKDIIFQGKDSTSTITALTLDMSDAGRAIFPTGMVIHDTTALANTTFDARDVDNVTSLNVQNNGATIQRSQSATAAPTLVFNKARGSLGSEADVNNGDFTGSLVFRGYHTNGFYQTATIESKVSGTHGTSDMPGTLLFSTSNDGSATPTSRMEIDQDGVMKLTGGVQSGRQDLLFNNSSISLATGATYSLAGILNTGCLISIGQNRSNLGVTYDHCLLFAEGGTAFTILSDPSSRFAINSATTSNKTNIYVNGNTIVILNEIGSTVTYSIAAFVFQGN